MEPSCRCGGISQAILQTRPARETTFEFSLLAMTDAVSH